MKIIATVRDRAAIEVEVSAPDVAGMRSTVLVERPEGHELAALRGRCRVDGNLVGTAVFRPTATRTVEAEGRDYSSARTTLEGPVAADQILLSLRVVD